MLLLRRAAVAALNKKSGTLDRSHYLLLQQLYEYGSAGVKMLADEFKLDVSTVSRQTAALEAKGYVRRLPDPEDGRASFFELTEDGLRELERTKQFRAERFKLLFEDWPEEDQQKFAELLARFNECSLMFDERCGR